MKLWVGIVIGILVGCIIGGIITDITSDLYTVLLNDRWDLNDELIEELKSYSVGDLDVSQDISPAEKKIIDSCSGKSLEGSVNCIVRKVELVYKYKVQPDNKNMTLEEISEEGGDCYDYSLLYARLGNGLGFNYSTTFGFNMDRKGHRITIISDGNDYCIVDQFSPSFCVKLKGSKD